MSKIQLGSAANAAERLLSFAEVTINGSPIGFANSVSYQITASPVRILTAGSRQTEPVVGQYGFTVSIRGFVTLREKLAALQKNIAEVTVLESQTQTGIKFKSCRCTSLNVSAQAGQILVVDELTLECEDAALKG